MTDEAIAKVCHEANRAYCETLGDDSQVSFEAAPEWQQASALLGVKLHRRQGGASASASHRSWLAEKEATGWVWGEEKDAEKKTHLCIMPFADLPLDQQLKDKLFKAVVDALGGF